MGLSGAGGADAPGPGAYEPGRIAEKKLRREKAISHSPFRSGSRRALPWESIQKDAPASTRARKIETIESAQYEGPAPGDYALPGAFDAAKAKPRGRQAGVTSTWAKSKTPRSYEVETPFHEMTPSAVHYTPNYSQIS